MAITYPVDNDRCAYIIDAPLPLEGDYTVLAVCKWFADVRWGLVFLRPGDGGTLYLGTEEILTSPEVTNLGLEGATSGWCGPIAWVAILDSVLADVDLKELSTGRETLVGGHRDDLVHLWDFQRPGDRIGDLIAGVEAFRVGKEDGLAFNPLPYGDLYT